MMSDFATVRRPSLTSDQIQTYEYDVAISCAGEQKQQARSIKKALVNEGANVYFYKDDVNAGKELDEYLALVYTKKARLCLMLISREYSEKVWTRREATFAQERALRSKGAVYVIPVYFDDTRIPEVSNNISPGLLSQTKALVASLGR